MISQIKIANYKADAYACTIDIRRVNFIQINGRIIKNELLDGENYVTNDDLWENATYRNVIHKDGDR